MNPLLTSHFSLLHNRRNFAILALCALLCLGITACPTGNGDNEGSVEDQRLSPEVKNAQIYQGVDRDDIPIPYTGNGKVWLGHYDVSDVDDRRFVAELQVGTITSGILNMTLPAIYNPTTWYNYSNAVMLSSRTDNDEDYISVLTVKSNPTLKPSDVKSGQPYLTVELTDNSDNASAEDKMKDLICTDRKSNSNELYYWYFNKSATCTGILQYTIVRTYFDEGLIETNSLTRLNDQNIKVGWNTIYLNDSKHDYESHTTSDTMSTSPSTVSASDLKWFIEDIYFR